MVLVVGNRNGSTIPIEKEGLELIGVLFEGQFDAVFGIPKRALGGIG